MMYKKALRHCLITILAMPVLLFLWLAPLPLATAIGRLLGALFYYTATKQVKATLQTIAYAFPEWSDTERRQLAKQTYRNQAGHMLQMFALNRLSKKAFMRHVVLDGMEIIQTELDKGKNVIVQGGHFGHWEWICPALHHYGFNVKVYTGYLNHTWVDRWVNHYRRKNAVTISKKQGMRGLLGVLRQKNQVLCLLSDQHYSRKQYWVYFFGQLSSIAPGSSLLAQRTNTSLVHSYSIRQPNGRYRLSFMAMPPAPPNTSKEEIILYHAQALHQALESEIRRCPEAYLWAHKRWRFPLLPADFTPLNRRFLAKVAKAGYPSPPPLPNTPNPPRKKPAFNQALPPVFLDRDGVLIEDVHYLSDLKQVELLEGVGEAIKQLNDSGHAVVVVSNQSAVARGIVDEGFVNESAKQLQAQLARHKARFDAHYYCPHHPDGQGIYRRKHPDRKPAVGMLLRACNDHGLRIHNAWMIGDQASDLQCGSEHGVIPLLVRTGKGKTTEINLPANFSARGGHVFDHLPEAVAWLLRAARLKKAAKVSRGGKK